jgi:hypothetical protein
MGAVMTSFNELNWHDSQIIEIRIFKDEQRYDCIDLFLDYIENYRPLQHKKTIVRFSDCYKIIFDLNRGIIAPESIDKAQMSLDDPEIGAIRAKFTRVGATVPESLGSYVFRTASTSSFMKIIAARMEFVSIPESA